MGLTARIINALRGGDDKVQRPRPGQVVRPVPMDTWREYPADGLTPSSLAAILRLADNGAVGQAMALFEQMEEKDAHLHAVANTRRLALTGLPWQILSAAAVHEGVGRAAADEVADYCRATLAAIERFDETLAHLALAMGRNIALAENVWEIVDGEPRLVDVVPVSFDRIAFDDLGVPRVLIESAPYEGMALPPHKFIVHTPHCVSGHPMRGGLLRVSAMSYLGKHFALKDWMIFAEVFGMPVRVARYEPSANADEKRELLAMLQSLGTDASAIFSKAVELQLIEAGHGKAPPPYETMCNFFNRELSKAWLGQTLTVETSGQTGTFSTAQIHNEIRLDLRQDDILKEGRTIRRDILAPLARLRFGPDAPVPFFQRIFEPPRDLRELADVLDVAVNRLRMRIPAQWAHDALGIPKSDKSETSLAGVQDPRSET